MTRQEAIEDLKVLRFNHNVMINGTNHTSKALDMAIEAMESRYRGNLNLISRQTVKEQMLKYGFSAPDMTVTEFTEDLLLSAQPECPEQLESAEEYCALCDHIEMCGWYPFEGCEFRSLPSAQPEQPTEIQDILTYLDNEVHPIVSPDNWNVYSELHDMISKLSAEPVPLSDAYMKAVWTWLLDYQTKVAELKGRYTPYEVLSWVANDWRKEYEQHD